MIDFRKFNHIISLTTYFNTEEKCKQAIIESRWADGDVVCPYCGEHHCVKRADGKFRCKGCRKNFSCLVGTIFENTKLPLIKLACKKLSYLSECNMNPFLPLLVL